MIAPCNSKTVFLPAVQQKCPEKAVFVFCKKSSLIQGPRAPIVSKFSARVSPKLLGFGRKPTRSFFEITFLKALYDEDSPIRLVRKSCIYGNPLRRWISLQNFPKKLQVISVSCPALRSTPTTLAGRARRGEVSPVESTVNYRLRKLSNKKFINKKRPGKEAASAEKTTDGKAMN